MRNKNRDPFIFIFFRYQKLSETPKAPLPLIDFSPARLKVSNSFFGALQIVCSQLVWNRRVFRTCIGNRFTTAIKRSAIISLIDLYSLFPQLERTSLFTLQNQVHVVIDSNVLKFVDLIHILVSDLSKLSANFS